MPVKRGPKTRALPTPKRARARTGQSESSPDEEQRTFEVPEDLNQPDSEQDRVELRLSYERSVSSMQQLQDLNWRFARALRHSRTPVLKERRGKGAAEHWRPPIWLVSRVLQGLQQAIRSNDIVALEAMARSAPGGHGGGATFPELTKALHVVAKRVLLSFDAARAEGNRSATMDRWQRQMVVALASAARRRKVRVGTRGENALEVALRTLVSGKDVERPFGRDPHQLIVRHAFVAFGLAANLNEAHNLTKAADQAE